MIRHTAENGHSYGFDTIYLMWRDNQGKICSKELINSADTKDYITIKSVNETMKL